ncbi:MAG: tRNA (adenosine(37)-N6)-threonylcarbamoyltransferase complex ATPase subunit type 1 TsaE [Planctomycetes bacterium]|nr:tRNA (adenosine(37)-N6)-threonylcarbamoyltransferase complex ATPase subunit type 1 TsaE [Planctomycetota bacterium]
MDESPSEARSWSEARLLDWIGRDPRRRSDAALLELEGGRWALCVDQVVEGIHFTAEVDPALAGKKLAARNLSDLAASGAEPRHGLLAISADGRSERWMRAFVEGVERELERFGAALIGGDLSRVERGFLASLSVGGIVHGEGLQRDAARVGESLYVTGALGGSILGRHLHFDARVEVGRALAERCGVRAAMDLSDGLALDLARFARASGVGAHLDAAGIPIHPDAEILARRDGRSALEHALEDGEDYELLFSSTLDAEQLRALGVPAHLIGRVVPAELGLALRCGEELRRLVPRGWLHGGAEGEPLRFCASSESEERTAALGRALGRTAEAGAVLALEGELGAGKTCLVRGLAEGLGSADRVSSPTFAIEGVYSGRLELHHFDAYFAEKASSYLELGGDEAFHGEGVAAVEWAERVETFLPIDHLRVRCEHRGPERRRIEMRAGGPFSERWLAATVDALAAALGGTGSGIAPARLVEGHSLPERNSEAR